LPVLPAREVVVVHDLGNVLKRVGHFNDPVHGKFVCLDLFRNLDCDIVTVLLSGASLGRKVLAAVAWDAVNKCHNHADVLLMDGLPEIACGTIHGTLCGNHQIIDICLTVGALDAIGVNVAFFA